jgi:DNA phosphorothioation-associated putative methyltransferase
VNLGFVVNVIEDPAERSRTLSAAWDLAQRAMIVSARLDWEPSAKAGRPHGDGILTARGTFQKYFSHEELRGWIDSTLGVESVAASPGVFYVFRTEAARQQFAAAQFVRRPRPTRLSPSVLLYGHRDLLQPLQAFLEQRGRLPSAAELSNAREVQHTFGSIENAYRIVSRALGTTTWEEAALRRQRDLLVYVALSRFGRRPKFSDLPDEVRNDVKAMLGSYTAACRLGDALLFSCGQREAIDGECRTSTVGKVTRDAIYVHVSALAELSPLLRTYEGCGRALMGTVDGATVIKLRRDKPKVSYLLYPDFDASGHPELQATFVADLARLRTYRRDYSHFPNRPVLHRKETFVAETYPLRSKFQKLTAAEEAAGLLDTPETIGFAEQWQKRLESRGYVVVDHDLVRM